MNHAKFNRNLCNHTPEELAPYEGKQVAWSVDGKQILAAADTWDALYDEIDRLGLKEMEYVAGFVPKSDASYL
jgi:hypothetical protein